MKQKQNSEQIEIASLISLLKFKNKLSKKEIISLVSSDEIYIPLSICSKKLSLLETIVKFLREELQIKNKDIATLLHRDYRTISSTYRSALQKQKKPFSNIDYTFSVPVSQIAKRTFSILETVVLYLHQTLHLSFSAIATLLHRNYQTIWTVERRAKLK